MSVKRMPFVLLITVAVLLPAWTVPDARNSVTPGMEGLTLPTIHTSRGRELGPG
jgi:hypothetical protein